GVLVAAVSGTDYLNISQLWSTTSSAYFTSQGLAFSTTSSDFWDTTKGRWSTTSEAFYWAGNRDFTVQGTGYLAPTTTRGLIIAASSTISALTVENGTTTNATSTNFFATTASSTNLFTSNLGVGSSSPWAKVSIELDATNPAFVIANQGSTTPSLYVGGVNQNGFVGLGTTTNASLARLFVDASMNQTGVNNAIAGIHEILTFNPSTSNTVQVGNRLVIQNAPTSATNTAVAQIVRVVDNSSLSNLVRGLEIVAAGGNNTYGVNTAVRATGHTFGVQGITTGLAGGTSSPAALYGENTGTTQGDVLRLYTSTMTTATSVAMFYHEGSAFSGAGLYMDFARGSGSFTGEFLDFRVNDATRFEVTAAGTTTIGQRNQTVNAAGLQIGFGGLCVDNDGSCTASTTGRITAVQYNTANADLAEAYYSTDTLEPGDIVYTRGTHYVGRASTSSDPIIGIVSTRPGVTLGQGEYKLADMGEYPIGLAGRVPVKVSDENGPIKKGDRVVLSSLPGIGMKESETNNTVVGIALEDFDATTYLSPGTIEVETTKMRTGLNICTTRTVTSDERQGGGSDIEGGATSGSGASSSDTLFEEDCVPEEVQVVPLAGDAQGSFANGKTVKAGKILVFINLGKSRLTVDSSDVADPMQIIKSDLDTNVPGINFYYDIDLNEKGISRIAYLRGIADRWYIDGDGNLVVKSLRAKEAIVEDAFEVGSQAKPTGITIYDSVTGEPYCLRMMAGVMASTAGKCGTLPATTTQQTTTTTQTTENAENTGGTNNNSQTTTETGTTTDNQQPITENTGETNDNSQITTGTQAATTTTETTPTTSDDPQSTTTSATSTEPVVEPAPADTTTADTTSSETPPAEVVPEPVPAETPIVEAPATETTATDTGSTPTQ
ncbi:MAG: hypothetical protein WC767_00400, partial [Candidatus Paceibacterota bacterium]